MHSTGLDSKFYLMMYRRFRNSNNLSQCMPPPPLNYTVFSRKGISKGTSSGRWEDNRWVKERKNWNKRERASTSIQYTGFLSPFSTLPPYLWKVTEVLKWTRHQQILPVNIIKEVEGKIILKYGKRGAQKKWEKKITGYRHIYKTKRDRM